jgi:hypothetical protein
LTGVRIAPGGRAAATRRKTTSSIHDPDLTITDPWLKLFTAGYVLVGISILVELARRLGMGFMIARAEIEEAKAATKVQAKGLSGSGEHEQLARRQHDQVSGLLAAADRLDRAYAQRSPRG